MQAILNLIIKLTGLLDLVLKATIILSIPSRLLGLVFGLIEYYFLTFIIISVLSYFPYTNNYIMESDVAVSIIENTPILPKYSNDAAVAANKIYTLWDNYGSYTDKNDFNLDVLDVSLKYQILKPLEAEKLINSGKLVIKNADSVINKYK